MVHGILIVEPSDLRSACLSALVLQFGDLHALASERDFNRAKLSVAMLRPRLVLVGANASTACVTDFVQEVKRAQPEVRIIAVDFDGRDSNVRAMVQAGADGYVLKHADQFELEAAIRGAIHGRRYRSANRASTVFDDAILDEYSRRRVETTNALTSREREVLKCAAGGRTNRQISAQLGIALSTVEKHRTNMFKKLGVRNLAELTARALENGWVTEPT